MRGWRYGSQVVAVMICLLSSLKTYAEQANADVTENATMMLELQLNGTPTSELVTVQRTPDGVFSMKASDLTRVRILIDPTLDPDAMVPLHQLSGVSISYDEAKQALALQVPDQLLKPYAITLYGQRPFHSAETSQSMPAAILNYGLYHRQQQGRRF